MSTTTARVLDLQAVGLDLRAVALDIAARGWPVFPIRPGTKKPPVFKRWPDHASTDPTRIHRWWDQDPARNVAIATGPAQLCVIDLDPRHMSPPTTGFNDALTRLPNPVPVTWTVATPHGWHLYYRAPTTPRMSCSVGRLGDGIDTRGHGGYVIAPGSRTRHGDYTLAADHPVADLPAELVELLTPPPPAPGIRSSAVATHPDAYLAAILTGEAHRVATAPVRLRNHTLFRSALVLGQLVAADEISEHHAHTVLRDAAAVHVGIEDFTSDEAERTIANGLRYSRSRPRYLRR
ncbi:bifunctional DNA primase/polymerase [Nocardia pseudovaccinii]|uniref:bifunctional DNA primase/polymerase n=1 Tax=Nocardia pseudovaccinii TaxID=189540 RepID=UPI0007A46021|nr:bifunctional DNA primase/polymerase [Nocardia pseudovaccinii]